MGKKKVAAKQTLRPRGVPEGIRTPGLPLRRGTLYPAELLRHGTVSLPNVGKDYFILA